MRLNSWDEHKGYQAGLNATEGTDDAAVEQCQKDLFVDSMYQEFQWHRPQANWEQGACLCIVCEESFPCAQSHLT